MSLREAQRAASLEGAPPEAERAWVACVRAAERDPARLRRSLRALARALAGEPEMAQAIEDMLDRPEGPLPAAVLYALDGGRRVRVALARRAAS